MSPTAMFKNIAVSAARFRALPNRVAADVAQKLTARMTRVAAQRGHKRHGDATPVENGVLIRAYTPQPWISAGWAEILRRSAKEFMRRAANGKD